MEAGKFQLLGICGACLNRFAWLLAEGLDGGVSILLVGKVVSLFVKRID